MEPMGPPPAGRGVGPAVGSLGPGVTGGLVGLVRQQGEYRVKVKDTFLGAPSAVLTQEVLAPDESRCLSIPWSHRPVSPAILHNGQSYQ